MRNGVLLAILVGVAFFVATEMKDRPHAPVRGAMAIGFGRPVDYQDCGFHTGQDWFAPSGTPIYAVEAGTVVHVGPLWIQGEGVGRGDHAIVIEHGFYSTTYSHNRAALVSSGDEVTRGQQIAELGAEGYAGGPHLHFEWIVAPYSGDWQQPFYGCDDYVDPGMGWGWF